MGSGLQGCFLNVLVSVYLVFSGKFGQNIVVGAHVSSGGYELIDMKPTALCDL